MTNSIVGQLHQRLADKIKNIDETLLKEYQSSITKIEQLRYDSFKQCMREAHNTPQCFKKSQIYEIKPQF